MESQQHQQQQSKPLAIADTYVGAAVLRDLVIANLVRSDVRVSMSRLCSHLANGRTSPLTHTVCISPHAVS